VHSEPRPLRLAVLIDADNVSACHADGLFQEIAKIGDASVRRIYGDFSGTSLKSWAAILNRHAVAPQQNFACAARKNASDIALVIDAMDLLHSGRFQGFCIVSSDSDFTRLASRIREEGVDVFGFGGEKTPESFRHACRRFSVLDKPAPKTAAVPERTGETGPPRPPSAAIPILRGVVGKMDGDDGWVYLAEVGSRMSKLEPRFDAGNYGYARLSELIAKTGAFELKHDKETGIRIRPKPACRTKGA
jgi:hypothetical protein